MTVRCIHEWSLVAYKGAPSVLRRVRCHNRTTDDSGRCWMHRGLRSRDDERVAR